MVTKAYRLCRRDTPHVALCVSSPEKGFQRSKAFLAQTSPFGQHSQRQASTTQTYITTPSDTVQYEGSSACTCRDWRGFGLAAVMLRCPGGSSIQPPELGGETDQQHQHTDEALGLWTQPRGEKIFSARPVLARSPWNSFSSRMSAATRNIVCESRLEIMCRLVVSGSILFRHDAILVSCLGASRRRDTKNKCAALRRPVPISRLTRLQLPATLVRDRANPGWHMMPH